MGVDETIQRHLKEKDTFEKARNKSWGELKSKHNAESEGRGEITPEMQKRFETEIAAYSQEWEIKTKKFNERQKIELDRELAKEEKQKAFKKETQELDTLIQQSVAEQDEIDTQQPLDTEISSGENKSEARVLSDKEKRRMEYLASLEEITKRSKDKGLER